MVSPNCCFFFIFQILSWGELPPRSPGFWLGAKPSLDGFSPAAPRTPRVFFFSPSDDTGAADAVGSKYFAKQLLGDTIRPTFRIS